MTDAHAEAMTRALEEVSVQLRDIRAAQRRMETVIEDNRARLMVIEAAIIPQGAVA